MVNPISPNRAGRSSRPISSLANIRNAIMTTISILKHDHSNPLRGVTIHPCGFYLSVMTHTTNGTILEFWPETSTTAERLSRKEIKYISIGPDVKPKELTALFQLLGNADLAWQNFNQPNIKFVK
ncbi:MAG: hypothetical protein PHG97_01930 [Candidatus Margulisbacteria bacterium]|nr:hypothetical protein [Candidatus Margulisiibacteriota bacterium]